jgi:regulator of sirC expression with transglutaminase-like and TPR domain
VPRAAGLVVSLAATAAIGGAVLWFWAGLGPPPPPRSADPPPLPGSNGGSGGAKSPAKAPLPPIRPAPAPPGANETFDAYLRRPESQIDVAAAALLLARESEAGLDPAAVLATFDGWTAQVTEVCRAAEDRTELIDTFLLAAFGSAGLSFDDDDPDGLEPTGWRFDLVFENRLGVCLGLALVVQSMADRAGVPCDAIALPGHVFLRVETAPGRWRNVEVTADGIARTDAEYRTEHKVPKQGEGTHYFTPIGRRGLLGLLCVNVAAWHLDRREPESALRAADRAIALLPGLPAAHSNRGVALLGLKRLEEARAEAAKALEVRPQMVAALCIEGAAALQLDDPDAAAAAFTRALESDPKDLQARLGQAQARLAQERWAEALAGYELVLRFAPEEYRAHYGKAQALLKLDRVVPARAALERVLALGHDTAAVRLSLGAAYQRGETDFAKAEEHWRRYVELGGDLQSVRDWLATRKTK